MFLGKRKQHVSQCVDDVTLLDTEYSPFALVRIGTIHRFSVKFLVDILNSAHTEAVLRQ